MKYEQHRSKLTTAVVRNLSLQLKYDGTFRTDCLYYDTVQHGLAVRVRGEPDGTVNSRTYVHCYRPNGGGRKQNWLKFRLGNAATLDIEAARKASRIEGGKSATGTDPAKERREIRNTEKLSLGALIGTGQEEKQGQPLAPYEQVLRFDRERANWKTALSALRRELVSHHKTDVRELERADILGEVARLRREGSPGAAQDLRKHTHTFLEWLANEKKIPNVLAGYREPRMSRSQIAKQTKKRSGRALTDAEIKQVWTTAGTEGAFGLMIRLTQLGGPRRSEPADMEWQRHVLADRVLFEDAKATDSRVHEVPRLPLIDEVLDAAKHFKRGTSDTVFPSTKTGGTIKGFSKMVPKFVASCGTAPWTMHDLRRTFISIMQKYGIKRELRRLAIGQKYEDKLDDVYSKDDVWALRRTAYVHVHNHIARAIGRLDMQVQLSKKDMKLMEHFQMHVAETDNNNDDED